MRSSAPFLTLIALSVAVAPTGLRAQGRNPSLAGHTFVPTTLIGGPFVATHFRTFVGMANAFGYDLGTVTIDDDTLLALDGKMTFVTVNFEQRQQVADWLALEGEFSAGARVGTNTLSALADGVSVLTGFRVGGIARVVRSDRVAASATLDVRRTGVTFLNLISFVEEIVDSVQSGGPLDSISLSSKRGAWRGRGGFRVAYAASRAVGFTALADVGFGEDFVDVDDASWDVDLGASVDLNLHSIGKAPLGFVAAYRFSTFGDWSLSTTHHSHESGLGISYIGNHSFTVGVQLEWMYMPVAGRRQLNAAAVAVRSRYYF